VIWLYATTIETTNDNNGRGRRKVLKLPGEWDSVPVRGSRRIVPATAGWDVLSQIRCAAAVLPQSLIRSLIINASLLLGMLTSAFMANV
jgi:hypothetical protein